MAWYPGSSIRMMEQRRSIAAVASSPCAPVRTRTTRKWSNRIDWSASRAFMAAMTRGRVAEGSMRSRRIRGDRPQWLVVPVQGPLQVADGRSRRRSEVPQRPGGRHPDLVRWIIEGGTQRLENSFPHLGFRHGPIPVDHGPQLVDGAGTNRCISILQGGEQGLGGLLRRHSASAPGPNRRESGPVGPGRAIARITHDVAAGPSCTSPSAASRRTDSTLWCNWRVSRHARNCSIPASQKGILAITTSATIEVT